jgi:hypothetical protein
VVVAVVVAACGAAPAPARLENRVEGTREPEVTGEPGVLAGKVVDVKTHAGLATATIVVTAPDLPSVLSALSDENGRFRIEGVTAGKRLVTVYYSDVLQELVVQVPATGLKGFVFAVRLTQTNP